MGRAFLARDEAEPYTPTKNEKLEDILNGDKCRPNQITASELAIYNWGTDDPAEIRRALIEQVGCAEPQADPWKAKLDPALGPADRKPILIPKPWRQESLELKQTYTIKLKKCLPAPAVAITRLDKWFIPGDETCRFEYSLEGTKERADRVDFDVYASHYCSATLTDRKPAFTPITDGKPIFHKPVMTNAGRTATGTDPGWRGETDAADGILKKRGEARYIDVACSPYTVLVRYYKSEDDKEARIRLDPFWPRFDEDANGVETLDPDSLKVAWKIEKCTRALPHGQIVFWDRDGEVYRRPLSAAQIETGAFDWSGDGKSIVTPGKMPYRVQVQVHTGMNEDNGVALAAMHTEVRLFVHKDVGRRSAQEALDHRKHPLLDEQCLEIAVAPFLPMIPTADKIPWFKWKLAELGFHPGPVHIANVTDADFPLAVSEYQRTTGKKTVDTWARLAVSGTVDAATREALKGDFTGPRALFGFLEGVPPRPRDASSEEAAGLLQQKEGNLIVWVDDRHAYTAGVPTIKGVDPRALLDDYRGEMEDNKTEKDGTSMPRPWIPLQAALPLVSRDGNLDDTTRPAVTDAMRRAIGPLRVDWTFTEVAENLDVSFEMKAATVPRKFRGKTYVSKVLDANKATHGTQTYTNCPDTMGGIRPANLSSYYKIPFALGGSLSSDSASLFPWLTSDDAGTSSVYTIVHDDVGQPDKEFFKDSQGRAGIYVHPSRIGGDGYRVRAQVSFDLPPGGEDHPNRAVLAARYPRRPQAHTCVMRIWRKGSIRGYVTWGVPSTFTDEMQRNITGIFRAGYVHLVHEAGTLKIFDLATLLDDTTFKEIVSTSCKLPAYKDQAGMSPDITKYIWPWQTHKHFGVDTVPADDISFEDFDSKFIIGKVEDDTWTRYAKGLAAHLMDQIEKKHGLFRGNLLVEFETSPRYYKQEYQCDAPARHRNVLIEKQAAGGSAVGDRCKVTSCTGKLTTREVYKCSCGCGWADANVVMTGGTPPYCPNSCQGTMHPPHGHQAPKKGAKPVNVSFTCDTCHRVEPNVSPYTTAYPCGTPCPQPFTINSTDIRIADGRRHLPLSALGMPLGVSYLGRGRGVLLWAHEIAHTRHFVHASGAPGYDNAHHDSAANPNNATLTDGAETHGWDRFCVMSYNDPNTAEGVRYTLFCGKCILKHRGWDITRVTEPTNDFEGP
jgi:hypothetical protein